MYYLKYDNENIFLEHKNKIILTEYKSFYDFMKELKNISKNKSIMELNGLKLNSKNTLVVDLTSISALTEIFSDDNEIIKEYLKVKLDNLILLEEDEESIKSVMYKYLIQILDVEKDNIDINFIKNIKLNANINIADSYTLIDMLKTILKSIRLKEIIIIYKRGILNNFKLQELEFLEDDRIVWFEICDKHSIIYDNENIILFDKSINQIVYKDFIELIFSKLELKEVKDKEIYKYLINKILFFAIDEKEVDIMEKYNKELKKLNEILKKEFKLNLMDTLGYI